MSSINGKNAFAVNGFLFENAAEAEQAKKEAEGVKYIRGKLSMDEPEAVLQIYNKMVRQNLFETAVGYAYLFDLQEYLRSIPFINQEEIFPIPVQHPALEESLRRRAKMTEKAAQPKEVNIDYKKKFRVTVFISGMLAVCVLAMFLITATADNATILNYETKLINRYEEWEKELTEREAALSEKEEALGIGQD